MTQTEQLLISIYQNAELGRDILKHMIKHSEDGSMREVMAEHFARYHEILAEAEKLLMETSGEDAKMKPARQISRAPIYASLGFNLKVDKTSSHMAEMLVLGNTMGLIDMARDAREFSSADEPARKLADRLIEAEQLCAKEARPFL